MGGKANKMLSKEEISEMLKVRNSLAIKMERIGDKNRETTMVLSKKLKEIMADIELEAEKEKNTWNPAAATRMKMAKRSIELFKNLNYFERWVSSEYDKGNVSKDMGKKLVSIASLVKGGKMEEAKREFRPFQEMIEINDRLEKMEEEIRESSRVLRKEQSRVERILAEISELEKETLDLEKIHRYEELARNMGALGKVRDAYLRSLLSKPVAELLKEAEKIPLKEHYPAFPGKEEIAQLEGFFLAYPDIGKSNAEAICEYFSYSEKKLSHICPETSRFRKIVTGNRGLFETFLTLGQTSFMAVDDENERALDFYSSLDEGAKKIVEQVRQLREDKQSCKEEYEKSRELGKKREGLSKYSKGLLEAERKDITRLLALLEGKEEAKKEDRGLLSILGSLLRK